jgi:hypothetical protein
MKKIMILAVALFAAVFMSFSADTPVAARSYQIRNCKFGELLRPENANNADGTHIVLYPAQPWKCMTWKLLPAGDSAFQLQNHFTHKTFDRGTNGTQSAVVQIPFAREASKRPSWKLEKLSNGFYRIMDAASGRSLTASTKDVVILAPRDETQEQQWELIETDPAKLTM